MALVARDPSPSARLRMTRGAAAQGRLMYVQKKSIDNIHIVRERDRQRFRELLAVLTLGIPIGLFLLLFTWQNLEVIRLGHAATRLQQKRKELQDANTTLQLRIDRLTSLDSVERKAEALGFVPTPPSAVVMIDPPAAPTLAGREIPGTPTPSSEARQ